MMENVSAFSVIILFLVHQTFQKTKNLESQRAFFQVKFKFILFKFLISFFVSVKPSSEKIYINIFATK